MFPLLIRWRWSLATQPTVQPYAQVPHGLGAGDDVEGWGQRAPLVEVAHPQLGPGELPLDVSVVLWHNTGQTGIPAMWMSGDTLEGGKMFQHNMLGNTTSIAPYGALGHFPCRAFPFALCRLRCFLALAEIRPDWCGGNKYRAAQGKSQGK